MEVIAKGLGEENIITMCLIFLCAGAFSGAVTAAGGVDSTVTRQIRRAGEMLGITLLDHIIIGDHCYTSMLEQGI